MFEEITKPTLVVNGRRARENIRRVARKAKSSGVVFRPHFKTHQSALVGGWFREEGVGAITVSSVFMAQYFAEHGWTDILIAFPLNIREFAHVQELATKVKIHVLVENEEAARFLSTSSTVPLSVWLEVDTNYHRSGVWWEDHEKFLRLAEIVQKNTNLCLEGVLTHAGHSYRTKGPQEIARVWHETVDAMTQVKERLAENGCSELAISVGDTPTASVVDDYRGVDEVRPGNMVYYDLMQLQSGSCSVDDIACVLACPVVSKHPERGELVLYGGAVHLSKEQLHLGETNKPIYGKLGLFEGLGWGNLITDTYVSSLSQEHGLVKGSSEIIEKIQVGDLMAVFPVHSCLVANLVKEMVVV